MKAYKKLDTKTRGKISGRHQGGLQRPPKVDRGRNFFLSQMVPFDLSFDPLCFLKVSDPPSGLQRPPKVAEVAYTITLLFMDRFCSNFGYR